MLTVDVVREDGVDGLVLRLGGEIDMLTAGAVTEVAERLLTRPPTTVIVDLTAVTFMDSSAIAAFADLLRVSHDTAGAQLLLRNLRARLVKLFELTHIYELFTWLPDSAHPAVERPD